MTRKKWAAKIAKIEGKKHQASQGDIEEILKIIAELQADAEVHGEEGPVGTLLEDSDKLYKKIWEKNDPR